MPALNDATNKVRARKRLAKTSRARVRAVSVALARRHARRRARDGWMDEWERPTDRAFPRSARRDDDDDDGARNGDFDRLTTRRASRANAGQSLVVEVHEAIEEKLGRVGGRGAAAAVERTVDESEVGGFGGTVVQFDSGRV